ncbi:MAG TPA: hydrogenase 4 subunit B [Rhizomicrobium sp.]|nr:hydrogenase 4 subunit B [Rhizomicrobium sp.]
MLATAVLACIALLLVVALLGIAAGRSRVASPMIYGACVIITSLLFVLSAAALGAAPADVVLPVGLPWLGAHFHLDALAAFFLAVVNLGGALASLYAIGHAGHETEAPRVLPFYPAFLAGMNLVVIAADAFSFLVAWEFMSLSSWCLVVSHHRERENVRAGYVYLLMAAFGTLCLLLSFGVLAGAAGGYVFADIRHAHVLALGPLVLVLVLLGAGSKAGLVPLHAWLPLAHPAAPSPVSALMSGVMTKVAVYAFIRIVFDLLGPPKWWWGVIVLVLAGITALLGVLQALMQHDLKRLLAYHTVENIGIIFMGLGLALAFRADGMAFAAALALTAALLHVLNHSVFKSLLFFGAGAVLGTTGERDMEHLGGLIHPMPQTAFVFLVGAAAISALPPLNGFVSEWLTFQAIFLGPSLPQWGLWLLVPCVGAALALAAALAAACFVKAFGITFLGRPRSQQAAAAHETDRFSRGAMFVLAALCLFLGILPGLAIDWMSPVTVALVHARLPEQRSIPWLTIIPVAEGRSSYNGLLVFLFISASACLAAAAIHRFASRALRRAPAWDCGTPDSSPLLQYTAGSFAEPIRRVFGSVVFRARERVTMPPPGDARPAVFAVEMRDIPWDVFYAPVARAVTFGAERLDAWQFMTIRDYLSLVFFALIILLAGIALWP